MSPPCTAVPVSGRFLSRILGVVVLCLQFFPASAESPVQDTLSDIQQDLVSRLPDMQKAIVGMDFEDEGFGSGVLVSKDGMILSAAHVTGGIRRPFTVILPGGKRVKAITRGVDAAHDAAMAQITEPGEYPFAEIAKITPHQGDWVFSLGHAGGYNKDRGPVVRMGKVLTSDESKIHTDCKLIGGDSGGPLFDKEGKLIGIHSRVGLDLEENLHVPVSRFISDWQKMKSNQWIADGPFLKRDSGFLNIFAKETPEGMKITEVPQIASHKAPAKEPLIRPGDLITGWNGKNISTFKELEDSQKSSFPGQEVTLLLKREGRPLAITAVLGNKSPLIQEPKDKNQKRL